MLKKLREYLVRLLTSDHPVLQYDESPEELTELIKAQFAKMGYDTPEKRQAWWDRQNLKTNDTLYISPEAMEQLRNWTNERATNCDDGKCDDDLRRNVQK